MDTNSTTKSTQAWYDAYYREKGADRNDLLTNPEVLFQHFAFDDSIISALRRAGDLRPSGSKVLDVGCGSGNSLAKFTELGFAPANLYGIDIQHSRIDEARLKYPNLNLSCQDATSLRFEDNVFDLVLESTMFVQIVDDGLASRIAAEMLRVTAPHRYILLVDWRYGKPGNSSYRAVTRKRIESLFSVGPVTDVVCQTRGALVPPIGRRLSRYAPSLYFLLRSIAPILVGSQATLLRKHSPAPTS